MKKIHLLFALLSISSISFAQMKVGTVDIDYILGNMPEMEKVKEKLEIHNANLGIDLSDKLDAYKAKFETYQADANMLTIAQKKEKTEELEALDRDIQQFQRNASALVELKKRELLQPLYQKIAASLEKLAKRDNYAQVLQTTDDVVYLDPKYDLTLAIMEDLNIPIPKEEIED